VLGAGMGSPVTRGVCLWKHLTGAEPASVDGLGRVGLDDWEFAPDVQDAVATEWRDARVAFRRRRASGSHPKYAGSTASTWTESTYSVAVHA
jgi:hypothetical protein